MFEILIAMVPVRWSQPLWRNLRGGHGRRWWIHRPASWMGNFL